jgi:CDP-glucose 4,6-dehydratase
MVSIQKMNSNHRFSHSPIRPFNGVYRGKRVLITGHTGFKGSWLSIWLKMLGAEVIGYSLEPPSDPSNFEACGLQDKLIHVHGDIRDYEHLLSVFKSYDPEFVFHLAAQPLVRLSYKDPRLTYETNVMGTVNLLEAVRSANSVRVMINVTSDKCYENREWVWGYRENDPVGGHDPYSSSKGCAELVTTAYRRSFFSSEEYGRKHRVGLASARAGNVIGGGDWGQDRLIPDCIRALSRGEEISIRNPNAIRPWQHVLEPLSGYLLLGTKLWYHGSRYSGAWNFGPMDDEIWPVHKVVEKVCSLWSKELESKIRYPKSDIQNPHEAHWLKLDCSKARFELAWRPVYSLEHALEKTISWYKEYYQERSCEEIRRYTLGQIEEYAEAVGS